MLGKIWLKIHCVKQFNLNSQKSNPTQKLYKLTQFRFYTKFKIDNYCN